MSVEVILLAVDLRDAKQHAAQHLHGRTWQACTVRSPKRVRGLLASEIHSTVLIDEHPERDKLLMEAVPCTLSSRSERRD